MIKIIKINLGYAAVLATLLFTSCSEDHQQIQQNSIDEILVENRSSGICENTTTGWDSTYQTVTFNTTEGTSNYPNCEFWIDMKMRICENQVDLIYVGFGAPIPIDPDCDQFDIDTNDPTIAEQVIEEVEQELIKAAAVRAALLVDPTNPLPICGVNPGISANLFKSACNKFCLVRDFKGETPSGFRVIILDCGTSCCQSTNEICIDPFTDDVKITEISSNVPASPCEISVFSLPCPRGTIFSLGVDPDVQVLDKADNYFVVASEGRLFLNLKNVLT